MYQNDSSYRCLISIKYCIITEQVRTCLIYHRNIRNDFMEVSVDMEKPEKREGLPAGISISRYRDRGKERQWRIIAVVRL